MSEEDLRKISIAASKLSLALANASALENQPQSDQNKLEEEDQEYAKEQFKINLEYRSSINTDELLKDMVARKIELQNTTYNYESSSNISSIHEELKLEDAVEFNQNKSKRALKREIRKREMEVKAKEFEAKLFELNQNYEKIREQDIKIEKELRDKIKSKVDGYNLHKTTI
jgi:hypothetical protein